MIMEIHNYGFLSPLALHKNLTFYDQIYKGYISGIYGKHEFSKPNIQATGLDA